MNRPKFTARTASAITASGNSAAARASLVVHTTAMPEASTPPSVVPMIRSAARVTVSAKVGCMVSTRVMVSQ